MARRDQTGLGDELFGTRLGETRETAGRAKDLTDAATPRNARSSERKGGDLFIVDNSDAEWKVRDYLSEWADIASAFDIATGYFEIGALLAIDGQWQKLEKLRVLMGDEVSSNRRSRSACRLPRHRDHERGHQGRNRRGFVGRDLLHGRRNG